jgi:hypothetical protein
MERATRASFCGDNDTVSVFTGTQRARSCIRASGRGTNSWLRSDIFIFGTRVRLSLGSSVGLHSDVLDIQDSILAAMFGMQVFDVSLIDDFLLAEERERDLWVHFDMLFYLQGYFLPVEVAVDEQTNAILLLRPAPGVLFDHDGIEGGMY